MLRLDEFGHCVKEVAALAACCAGPVISVGAATQVAVFTRSSRTSDEAMMPQGGPPVGSRMIWNSAEAN